MSQYWCVRICMTVWLVRKCQVYAAHALKRSDTRAQVSVYRQIELITIADADEGLLSTKIAMPKIYLRFEKHSRI